MNDTLLIKNGSVLVNGRFERLDLYAAGARISRLAGEKPDGLPGMVIDAADMLVAPGFIDIHTHGANGLDIMTGSGEDLDSLAAFYARQGTTSFLATTLTASGEDIIRALERIGRAVETRGAGARMLGVHLEGPFLCEEFRGAQPGEYIVAPSIGEFERFNEASGDKIKLVTIAPEAPGALDFIRYCAERGIAVSLGHSGATYAQAVAAIAAGAKSCTHLFNGMRGLHHHEPSIVGACLEGDVFAEIICDGRHLAPVVVRLVRSTKGIDRIIAVTDSMIAAGLPDGIYTRGSVTLVVKDRDVRLVDGSRAGSTLTTIQALRNLVEFTGLDLADCLKTLTINPARLLGLDDVKGGLEEGKDADLVILDRDFTVRCTIVEGRIAYDAGHWR